MSRTLSYSTLFAGCTLVAAAVTGCDGERPSATPTSTPESVAAAPSGAPPAASAPPRVEPATEARFLHYVAPRPASWRPYASSMRSYEAMWSVPGASGDSQAHLIVERTAGSTPTVVANWSARFIGNDQQPVDPALDTIEVDRRTVTLVELAGQYRLDGAPAFTPDHTLLGAVWDDDAGAVQARLVGRTATVERARDDFMTFVRGARSTKPAGFPENYYFIDRTTQKRYRNTQLLEGMEAPELELTDWIGEPVSLAELRDENHIVVVDFWATWCVPCKRAIPHNVELVRELGPRGVTVLGVHDSKRGYQIMPKVAAEMNINYPVAVDVDRIGERAWNVRFWPTYAVVDHRGIVRAAGLRPDRIRDVVEALLKERDG